MMPSEFRHQKISIFADLETLKKEERARRRIFRIQQVRQQSKLVASQVIARTRTRKEKEEDLLRQQKEEKLKQWKHQKLSSLRVELDYGLESIGESFKTVDKEISALKEKQDKKLKSEKLAQERGLIAAKEVQKELEEEQLREERRRRDREELRTLENLRAKAVTCLPVSSNRTDFGKSSTCEVPTLSLPSSSHSRSSEDKTRRTADSGNKVEVYNYSQPLQQQFSSLPDNIVEKLTPSTCKVTASEQAKEELKAQAEKVKERAKKEQLSHWLGTAACARKSLQKEYNALLEKLPVLVQQKALTRIDTPVTLEEIAQIEKEKKSKQQLKLKTKKVTIAEPPEKIMEPHQNGQDTPPQLNFTEFPTTQFTEEEAGALGATASSLQVLLDSLAEESRRRLQEVVDDDDFDFYDEDFDEPPPESPPPPTSQVVSTRKVTLDVKTTHQVVVEGTPPSSPSTITSTSEVNVTVTSKSKNKRKKKKAKAPSSDSVPDTIDAKVDSTAKPEGQKATKKKSKKKSQTSEPPKEKLQEESSSSGQVSGNVDTEDSETLAKVVKSVEIDDHGVAYIKKTPTQDVSVSESVSGTARRDLVQGQTSYSEDVQYRYNKQSFVSNSTQYHSPPDNLLADQNIEKYLKSIEKEKSEVEAFLQSKSKQKSTVTTENINLPQYIGKLLTMTRDSVDNLSVSDVTETSSDVSGSHKKKKRRSKKKSTGSESSSASIEMVKSPSTENSEVTVSLPSPGLPAIHTSDSASGSEAQLSSSTSLDSKLKFSESSSHKESSLSDDSKLKNAAQTTSGVAQSYEELDSTAYLSLQDLSSKVPTKVSYGPTSKSVNIHIDLSKLPAASQTSDAPARPSENARLSTIIEADSLLVAEEDKSVAVDSSSSIFDVEAELKKRGLPTLAFPTNAQADRLLSPELEKKLQEMNVVPWSSNMMSRMKQAENLSSSSDEIQPKLSDSSCSEQAAQRPPTEPGISHSTPVSMEGGLTSELTSNQTQRFFLQDSVVSPIAPTEEKESRSLSS